MKRANLIKSARGWAVRRFPRGNAGGPGHGGHAVTSRAYRDGEDYQQKSVRQEGDELADQSSFLHFFPFVDSFVSCVVQAIDHHLIVVIRRHRRVIERR